MAETVNCTAIFRRRRTEIGICCAFNQNRPTESEFNQGVRYNHSKQLYIKSPGFENGLSVHLIPHINDSAYSIQSNMGIKVVILETQNFADDNLQPITVTPNLEMFLGIVPRKISGDETMRDVSAEVRGCYFFDEKDLIYKK